MGDPVTTFLGGAGGLKMLGSVMGGIQSNTMNRANAKIQQAGADITRRTRENQKIIDAKQFRKFQGRNMVASGGSGNVAELTDADFDDIADFERDQLFADFSSEVEALNLENNARISKFKGKAALEGSIVQAGVEGLNTAGQIAVLG